MFAVGGSGTAAGGGGGGLSAPGALESRWDPLEMPKDRKPTPECLRRINRDITELMSSPLPGIVVCPDDSDALLVHVLIVGPEGTPYENGVFYFVVAFPEDYPSNPPKAKIMTTGGGSVRFNPNLYATGKVCVSILGTWHGPGWSAAMSLSSVLLSIQTLMTPEPYRNEPGFEKAENVAVVKAYSDMVAHETMRVAVIDNVARKDAMPEELRSVVVEMFGALADVHIARCTELAARLDGKSFVDPLSKNTGVYAFGEMAKRLSALAEQYEKGELS